jgi:hypothetical protein
MRSTMLGILGAGALTLFLACGGGDSGSGMATINVKLVDGPINGFSEINLNVQKVEIAGEAGWITLGTPNRTINLLSLTGGVSATLANGATVPAGHFTQMRLVLGSGNTIKLADGTVADLTTPSAMQSGIKLIVNFDVQPGTTKDVVIDFDAAHSIQVVQTGASSKYILRPTIRAVDVLATGSISGTFTDGSGAALGGSEVTAQVLDASGNPTVVRRTSTGADGSYILDLLPVGGAYYVVAQPVVGGQSFAAKASGAFTISSASPTFVYDASFVSAPATGGVNGTITPTAGTDQHDVVELLQTLAPGGLGSATFVLRSGVTVVAVAETYGFSLVPTGTYFERATRNTLAMDGTTTVSSLTSATFLVTANMSTVVDFSF